MKSVFAASVMLIAAALAPPTAALAQATPAPATTAPAPAQTGAAGSLPNTFDRPAAAAPAPTPAAPVLTPSDPAKVAAAETALKTTIVAMQAGTPNYGDMTPDLAEKVRGLAPNLAPIFQQLGAVQTVAHLRTQDGAELFDVAFANARTEWVIAQNADGKIVALLFRPAPPQGG